MTNTALIFASVALGLGVFLLLWRASYFTTALFAALLLSIAAMIMSTLGFAKPKWFAGPLLHEELTLVASWIDEPDGVIYLLVIPPHADRPQTLYIPFDPKTADDLQSAMNEGLAIGKAREVMIRLDGARPTFKIVDPPALPPKA